MEEFLPSLNTYFHKEIHNYSIQVYNILFKKNSIVKNKIEEGECLESIWKRVEIEGLFL